MSGLPSPLKNSVARARLHLRSELALMVKKKNGMQASLRQFVRTKGADYLRDVNVSSIGIGYKVADGKPTNEIAMGRKMSALANDSNFALSMRIA